MASRGIAVRTMRSLRVAALTLALTTGGCFAQSAEMAENCGRLRTVWTQAQKDMRAVVSDVSLGPQEKSRLITARADQLSRESRSIGDERLRAAMDGVASDFRTMAKALGGVGSPGPALPPLPPMTNIRKLNEALDERCPV